MAASKLTSSLSLLLLLLLLVSYTTTATEQETLLEIKKSWGNPPSLLSWGTPTTPHCNWTGIICSDSGAVTDISLSNANLTLPIPPAVCDLRNLSLLDLSYNNLPGPFPSYLFNCLELTYLDISQNLFIGDLPLDIDRLSPRLTYLSLSGNNFTGDIPSSIARIHAIQTLQLDNNLFNGTFPAEISNLSKLQTLWLANNPFTPARIPPEFGNLTELTMLWLSSLNLIGEIPDSFGKLSKLQKIDMSINNLTGPIPNGIWMLENLQDLFLFANHLTGEINGTIGALGLLSIDISINQLSGSIPEGFGKLKKLQVLAMYYNQLSGEIPASIAMLPDLTDIRLFNNKLTGVLPPELGKHSKLWNFEVDDNRLSGLLPEYLCAGHALTDIVVFNNNFSGKLPESLGDCHTLDNLQIDNNKFTGDVPAGIWTAVNLTTISMHHNALTGALPEELPRNLSRLDMGSNQFNGSLPSTATKLTVFRADNNLFSGDIVAAITGMPRLQVLSLGGNMLSGKIPDNISTLRFLTDLNMSNNNLSGEIPVAIGSLPVLTSLDLSSNDLSGVIPQEMGNLKLNSLNLRSNRLSGEIPASLQNAAYDQSFLSNSGLCSSNGLLHLNPCGAQSQSTDKLSNGVRLLFVILGAALVLIAVVLAFMVARAYRQRAKHGDSVLDEWKLTSFHALAFSEDNIVRGLIDENEIGSGGSGRVYRVALGESVTVAVKKIWNSRKLDSKLEKEFQAEVQILGSIRHANIVKLLCCVSGSDAKLLVYEYMGNGSLDQWLHRHRHGGRDTALDWQTRVAIATGAAKGLCYMHHDCSPPIVHRDVKSSNILLDSEFGAKIADFGLARMLVKAGEADSVSAIAGSFGYMAPECAYLRKVNEKVDVYSFGVVLLELVTGREANDEGKDDCLAEWVWRHLQGGGKVVDVVDEEIRNTGYWDEIEMVLRLGLLCTGALPSGRPTMKEVLQVLLLCGPAGRNGGFGKSSEGCDVVPLLQPNKKGSRRVKPSDEVDNDHFRLDLEKGSIK